MAVNHRLRTLAARGRMIAAKNDPYGAAFSRGDSEWEPPGGVIVKPPLTGVSSSAGAATTRSPKLLLDEVTRVSESPRMVCQRTCDTALPWMSRPAILLTRSVSGQNYFTRKQNVIY